MTDTTSSTPHSTPTTPSKHRCPRRVMAGRRHVVSVPISERKSHDEFSRLPTTTSTSPSDSAAASASASASAHRRSSSDASPPPFPSRSFHLLSSAKDRDRDKDRDKDSPGFDLKRLPFIGEKISSLTSGGSSTSTSTFNTHINPHLPASSSEDTAAGPTGSSTTASNTPSSSASTLVSSSGSGATMASPPLASSMVQNPKLHASPSKVRFLRCSRQFLALVVLYPYPFYTRIALFCQ